MQAYGKELAEAYEWLQKYRLSRKEAELHQAWDLYYHVFKRINKQLPSLVMLELHYVSPALAKAEVGRLTVHRSMFCFVARTHQLNTAQ